MRSNKLCCYCCVSLGEYSNIYNLSIILLFGEINSLQTNRWTQIMFTSTAAAWLSREQNFIRICPLWRRFISIITTGGANGPQMCVKNRVDRVLPNRITFIFHNHRGGNNKSSIYSINTSLVSPEWVLIIVVGKHWVRTFLAPFGLSNKPGNYSH